MKRAKPIFVGLQMKTDMETLWEHTQRPEKHVQWDLRFTSITYLPRVVDGLQLFQYTTRIGYGLAIEGTGQTRSREDQRTGERISTLVFGSEQPVSLIRTGRGYWRYTPDTNGIIFTTQYDYETRFGRFGRQADRWLFRPMFGYATAWSFELLRIWLEKQIPPALTIERALIHYASVLVLALMWCYEGLVPKLLFPEAGELALLRQSGVFIGLSLEKPVLMALGIAEAGAGLITILYHRRQWMYKISILSLILLAAAACLTDPYLLAAPFNPLTISIPMAVIAFTAARTAENLPQASRCRRKAPARAREESGIS